jgi:hypothetical protein
MPSSRTPLRAGFARRIILLASLVLGPSVWGLCQGQEGVDVSFALQSSSVTLHEPVGITRQGPFVVVIKDIATRGLGRVASVEGVETVVSRLSPEDRRLEPEIRQEMARSDN